MVLRKRERITSSGGSIKTHDTILRTRRSPMTTIMMMKRRTPLQWPKTSDRQYTMPTWRASRKNRLQSAGNEQSFDFFTYGCIKYYRIRRLEILKLVLNFVWVNWIFEKAKVLFEWFYRIFRNDPVVASWKLWKYCMNMLRDRKIDFY